MKIADPLKHVIAEGREARVVEDGIYSVLADTHQSHPYDRAPALYDAVVGTQLYNRLLWGDAPQSYRDFARQAVHSHANGLLLDAACGSLLFTAAAYLGCGRTVIACDQSLDMLRRARARLKKLAGSGPENVILVQADLGDVPFRQGQFQTLLCMNVLHHFEDAVDLLRTFRGLLVDGGQMYLTTLVRNDRRVGDAYLSLLHRRGWIVAPRARADIQELLDDGLQMRTAMRTRGNMAYVTTA